MSPKKVQIIDLESGKLIREGTMRAMDMQPQERKIFGLFTVADILKVGSVWVAITVLVIGFDFRLKYLEADKITTTAMMVKVIDFVKSSDTFNSSFFGTQFENGKPVNPSFRANNHGSVSQ